MPKANDGLPDEKDITAGESRDDGLEVSVVDDTPVEDRGRTPLSKEKLDALNPTDEELNQLSERTKKRLLQLQHAVHDQRRVAEQAAREREAALQYAAAQQTRAKQLEERFSTGEQVFVDSMKEKAKVSIGAAKAKLKAATEAFDSDAIVEATQELNRALIEEQRYATWRPQTPSQDDSAVVQPGASEQRVSVPKPDHRAQAWASKNSWFGEDDEMTSFAYGVHAKLAKQGITAESDPDQYYGAIDRRMRDVFPDRFEDAGSLDDDHRDTKPRAESTPRTPVAPVRRSASGKKVVTITKSQEAMAKRLGITPQQYAEAVAELEARNG